MNIKNRETKVSAITKYRASDGKEFTLREDAEEYQDAIDVIDNTFRYFTLEKFSGKTAIEDLLKEFGIDEEITLSAEGKSAFYKFLLRWELFKAKQVEKKSNRG